MTPYYGQFEVVHCRSVAHGIPDYQSFLVEAAKCLKPGGVLLSFASDVLGTLDEHQNPVTEMEPGKEGFSAFNRFLKIGLKASAVSPWTAPSEVEV